LLGFLFESLVVRDVRIQPQAADATVLQCRDNTGLEIDAVVEAADVRNPPDVRTQSCAIPSAQTRSNPS